MTTTFTSTISGLRGLVVESIRAARAYDAARSNGERRAVLDRFVSQADHGRTAVEKPGRAVVDGRYLSRVDPRVAA
ncbi:hypothetical protein E4P40_14775 [Blastococcus sp. CT_GayMR20]|uniref:hypothetical protein n=1 Tax=Blastococcus sp. CT_GayMR20 TaxID=2559609 RepID=UPI00107351EB|nr:hypothetical protein [Blastococcus sp. CT_GayMR20]TFV83108.1 hypothetical protein E4P40_14775 [Blastococcus sp. CT_GayMR20]